MLFRSVVTNTPDVLTDATAEIGMLLILGACRRAHEGILDAKESNWKWSADYLIGKQLTGSRLGILGMGRIGQKIAKIAKSLGMLVHYHNRSKLSNEKEGMKIIEHCKNLSVMGFKEIIVHLPRIWRIMNNTVALVEKIKPDRIILIDYPGFNLRFAKNTILMIDRKSVV